MNIHREVEVELHAFLTLALDAGKWSASCSAHFTPREETLVPTGQKALHYAQSTENETALHTKVQSC